MNFYKHYFGDYARKTAHLSLIDHGAYRVLLDHYYATRAPLPAEMLTLCRICRATTESETESVLRIVNEFFPLREDGRRHNPRADQEITKWTQQAEINREIGKKGGRPRKNPETESVQDTKPKGKPNRNPKLEVRSQKLEVDSKPSPKSNGAETWQAYATAYHHRYGVDPVRNAKVNALISKIIASIGNNDAPHVAAFYVGLNSSWYVAKGHAIQFLLADAEKIRTEWATGRQITQTEAQQADKRQSNKGVFAKLISEAENEKTKP